MSESTDNTTAQPVPRPLTDLIGLDPNFTGGMGTEEYLRRQRCGECDEALSALAKVTAERDEAQAAVLELDTERPTADISRDLRDIAAPFAQSAWHGHAALMIEAADKLDALLGELANARTLIDGYAELLENSTAKADRHFQESVQSTNERDAARREAEQAQAVIARARGLVESNRDSNARIARGTYDADTVYRHSMVVMAYDDVLDVLNRADATPVAAPKDDEPEAIQRGSFIRTGVVGSWYIACGYCKWQAIAHSQERADQVKASHDEVCPVALPAAAPVVPASADAGVHETNGIYRERAAGAGDGEQDATNVSLSVPCPVCHVAAGVPCIGHLYLGKGSSHMARYYARAGHALAAPAVAAPDATCCPRHELLCRIAQTQGVEPCCGHCPTWETADAVPDADSGETEVTR